MMHTAISFYLDKPREEGSEELKNFEEARAFDYAMENIEELEDEEVNGYLEQARRNLEASNFHDPQWAWAPP